MPSPPAWWMAAGVVCHPCMDAVSWCVNCAAGPAAFSSCCLLSLAVSAALRPSPSCSILFLLAHGSADSSDSTTGDDGCDGGDGDGAAPCWSLGSCAAAALLCALRPLGVLDMYLVMRTRWLCRWMCYVLRVTAA
ncbi:hypothetical protein TcCL_NonESM12521 [Trypanosoma cruzi]|nr:hypothetical protein TcCL_NonESM12521 [Trypanosoma cruzi]